MMQLVFFALLVITLLAGSFSYFAPLRNVDPLKFMLASTGLDTIETSGHKVSQQIDMKTSNGFVKMHKEMDDMAIKQNEFLDALKEQQQLLKDSNKDIQSVLFAAQKQGGPPGPDILQLESLASDMQNEGRLLVNKGDSIIALNNQLLQSRRSLVQQIDLANLDTQGYLNSLQQQDASLNKQASDFFDQVTAHNQQVRNQMETMQNDLQEISDNPYGELMLDKERGYMIRLADNEERCRDLMERDREKIADTQQWLEDLEQKTNDLIDSQRQKEEEQQAMIQERIADQQQTLSN